MSNKIIDFYVLETGAPFTWGDFYSWTYKELEEKHDYIQWIFPLAEKSRCQPHTPVLDGISVLTIRNNKYLFQSKQCDAFKRMANFYGFDFSKVNKEDRGLSKHWVSPHNHNYLRITRILKSLVLFGNQSVASYFYGLLVDMKEFEDIPSETIKFWHDAVYSSPY